MSQSILLATNNEAKILRFRKLLEHAAPDITLLTPKEADLPSKDIEETGQTLTENATLKAQAYASSTDFPILANDTGFWVHGEGFILAPKRTALLNQHPSTNLSQTEIAQAMLAFWKGVAQKHGGRVDATWIESFVILHPDGTLHCVESRRELLLTDQEFGQSHPDMPLRALYISKATGKPALNHTESEELLEMRPVMDALVALIETLPRSL